MYKKEHSEILFEFQIPINGTQGMATNSNNFLLVTINYRNICINQTLMYPAALGY